MVINESFVFQVKYFFQSFYKIIQDSQFSSRVVSIIGQQYYTWDTLHAYKHIYTGLMILISYRWSDFKSGGIKPKIIYDACL